MDNENKQSHLVLWAILTVLVLYVGSYAYLRISDKIYIIEFAGIEVNHIRIDTPSALVFSTDDFVHDNDTLLLLYRPLTFIEVEIRKLMIEHN